MRNEFLFKVPEDIELKLKDAGIIETDIDDFKQPKFYKFKELLDIMTEILSEGILEEIQEMDHIIIKIFDTRQQKETSAKKFEKRKGTEEKAVCIGSMILPTAIQKFR
jgi:hypothetical protein